jgi:hypothetical protein
MGLIILCYMVSLNGAQDLKFCMTQTACKFQWMNTNEHGRSNALKFVICNSKNFSFYTETLKHLKGPYMFR